MAGTYYKYAERDADSQINWAEVGAQASGMLLEVNRVRQEKKDALAQAQRETLNNLMNSPQGVDQSVNSKINQFAHDLIEQTKIDYDLLIRGDMSVRDYTLKRQNQLDGTNNLFKVAPELQKAKKTTLDGIANGSLQSAANIFQGSFVEKMVDLSNLSINVNSPTGEINFGLLEDKIIDGKTVKVMGKNIATSNVLLGMLAQPIQSFYTDKETTAMVERFGDKKAVVYQAATTVGAGTISEYLGPTYLASIKDPVVKEIANNFNKAIDDMVASRIGGPSNSYNLMGVITEDLAKYGSDDFTYNSDEAKANTNKILVKINQATHRMDLDETGANYERMKKEANDFVKNQIILKLDEEKKISTTGQLSESAETVAKVKKKYETKPAEEKDADTATNMIGKLWYGDENQAGSAKDYFKGLKNAKGEILFEDIIRTPTGITVVLPNGNKESISFIDSKGKPRTQEDFIASAGPLLAGQLDVSKSLDRGSYKKGAKFNDKTFVRGTTIKEFTLSTDVLAKPSQDAVEDINNAIPEGFSAKDIGGRFGNEVEVTSPTGKKYIVKTKRSANTASASALGLEDFIKLQQKIVEEQRLKGGKTNQPAASNKGVGSKY
jgi:hypothetical protein